MTPPSLPGLGTSWYARGPSYWLRRTGTAVLFRTRLPPPAREPWDWAQLPLAVLAAPVMPAFAALAVGWTAAMLTVREYPSEVGARRWMQEHQPPGAVRHISTTS